MTSPASSSEGPSPVGDASSKSFNLLSEKVRRWIWKQGWTELHDVQESSVAAILSNESDLIIAAATASGKTEAAFLPLLSQISQMELPVKGFQILYISPLKALINDQFRRLEVLCEELAISVHPWHGDVSSARKAKARRTPGGVLLITPESLEATFITRGSEIPHLFDALHAVIVDELHAFIGSERGVHLLSLLNRLELATSRRIRRIGLSATLGDLSLAAEHLRPNSGDAVSIIESRSEKGELRVQVRGYVAGGKNDDSIPAPKADDDAASEVAAVRGIASHIFKTHRGQQNLVFAGSRGRVELYADALSRCAKELRVPNEFFAHHANLAREHRHFVENRLKEARLPTTAICTSTLELGIDIGEVENVAQIGPPYSVSSLRQRLGRSGRRPGKPAILRAYITEDQLGEGSDSHDLLRMQLVQTIAMIDLLLEGWCEPAAPVALHLSTLVHQVLSVIAERGGVRPKKLYEILCVQGPFSKVSPDLFGLVLRHLGSSEVAVIEQAPDGTLLLGSEGERLVESYTFYPVFMTPQEYRVIAAGKTLGTLPLTPAIRPGLAMIFSGRRWRVLVVDDKDKVIEVSPDPGGTPPQFGGEGADIHDRVAETMQRIYASNDVPIYLNEAAATLLDEARKGYRRLGLEDSRVIERGEDRCLIFGWQGSIATTSLAMALCARGISSHPRHIVIETQCSQDDLREALGEIARAPQPNPLDLAEQLIGLEREKFHPYLDQQLLLLDAAHSRIAASRVPEFTQTLLQ